MAVLKIQRALRSKIVNVPELKEELGKMLAAFEEANHDMIQ